MKVSIVTVCFNSAANIRDALDSVRAQTYRPLELVVVDGASTDVTLDIVQEYSDVLGACISEPDAGTYDAMNKAIDVVRGDVVFFLNSDDRFADPAVVADVVRYMERSGADMVYGDVTCIYPAGRVRKNQAPVNASTILFEGLCHQSVFVKRKIFSDVGRFDLRYWISADFDWFVRVFRNGYRCRYMPRVIADYSMGGVSELHLSQRAQQNRSIREKYVSALLWPPLEFCYKVLRKSKHLLGLQQPTYPRSTQKQV